MTTGRPTSRPRTPLGERIAFAREQNGLSQADLARKLGTTQRVISYWEREPVALKPEQLATLADVLDVSGDYIIGREPEIKKGTGPTGKAKVAFEAISQLPRRQQDRILGTVEDMLLAQKAKQAS